MTTKLHEKVQLNTVITCPSCKNRQAMMMPRNYCEKFFHCPNCHTDHEEKPGDCCIFCSYADLNCPNIQSVAYRMRDNYR